MFNTEFEDALFSLNSLTVDQIVDQDLSYLLAPFQESSPKTSIEIIEDDINEPIIHNLKETSQPET